MFVLFFYILCRVQWYVEDCGSISDGNFVTVQLDHVALDYPGNGSYSKMPGTFSSKLAWINGSEF